MSHYLFLLRIEPIMLLITGGELRLIDRLILVGGKISDIFGYPCPSGTLRKKNKNVGSDWISVKSSSES